MSKYVTFPAVSTGLPTAVGSFLASLRNQGIVIQYATPVSAKSFDIGLSNLPAQFPFQLGQLAARLEQLLPNCCLLTRIKFSSTHPALGDKCTVSLSLYCHEEYRRE